MSHDKVFVTRPYLPPLQEFIPHLEKIWTSGQLTNSGPYHKQFEQALAEHLGVPYVALFTNATIALVTALQALRITGEVITTPYSFVATAHSLLWNGIKPVFVDVDPDTLNLDPQKIEAAIKDLEDVLKSGDKAEIDTKLGALSTASQKLGEKVYADMQAQQAAAGAAGGAGAAGAEAHAKDDDVVDADFKEVKDNK